MKTEYYFCHECKESTEHTVSSNDQYFYVVVCNVCGFTHGKDKQDILEKPINKTAHNV